MYDKVATCFGETLYEYVGSPWWKTTSSSCLLSIVWYFYGCTVGRIAISPNPTFLQVLIIRLPLSLLFMHNPTYRDIQSQNMVVFLRSILLFDNLIWFWDNKENCLSAFFGRFLSILNLKIIKIDLSDILKIPSRRCISDTYSYVHQNFNLIVEVEL